MLIIIYYNKNILYSIIIRKCVLNSFSFLYFQEPNTTLAPGTYFAEYVARDSSGNIGTCSFEISIIRKCTS